MHVTADSAIQQRLEPFPRSEYFTGPRAYLGKRFLIGVGANDYSFPATPNPQEAKARYEAALIAALDHVTAGQDAHVMFFSQLYGRVHSDVAFLRSLGDRLRPGTSWELADPSFDSDMQRRLFGMLDTFIASRYHPNIFGHIAGVPGICVYYEHKQLGFMRQLGLERYAFDIRNIDTKLLCERWDELIAERAELHSKLEHEVPKLCAVARKTTDLTVSLLERSTASQL